MIWVALALGSLSAFLLWRLGVAHRKAGRLETANAENSQTIKVLKAQLAAAANTDPDRAYDELRETGRHKD